ncbi:MAG: DNA repair protein RecO [Chitinophagales bacterium]
MLFKTRGIVLKNTKYSESSIITKVYTEAFGIQTYIISGLGSKRSKSKPALFQHGNLLELVVYHKEMGNIFRISDSDLAYYYKELPFSVVKSSLMLFYIEILNKTLKEHEKNEELFNFLFDNLIDLDQHEKKIANHHIWFLLALSKFLGFYPAVSEGKYFDLREGMFVNTIPGHQNYLSERLTNLLRSIINPELKNFDQIELSPTDRKQLLDQLLSYYKLHLPEFGEVRSIQVLEELFR